MLNIKKGLIFVLTLGMLQACSDPQGEVSSSAQGNTTLASIKKAGVLKWGADVIGGIPYVYEDPEQPGTYIGFEMDIAKEIANQLGVKQQLVIRAWDSLVPELQRESYDLAMNGLEDTEGRERIVLFSDPYFVYTQQITVRNENEEIKGLSDLKGKKVATLSGTAAEDILRQQQDVAVHINPEIIYSYKDLEDGKVDAVVLDTPIAAAYGAPNPKLKNVGESFGEGNYVIAFRDGDAELKQEVDKALKKLKESGKLAAIYEKWGIMNSHQAKIGIM